MKLIQGRNLIEIKVENNLRYKCIYLLSGIYKPELLHAEGQFNIAYALMPST